MMDRRASPSASTRRPAEGSVWVGGGPVRTHVGALPERGGFGSGSVNSTVSRRRQTELQYRRAHTDT